MLELNAHTGKYDAKMIKYASPRKRTAPKIYTIFYIILQSLRARGSK